LLSMDWKSMESIAKISYYLSKCQLPYSTLQFLSNALIFPELRKFGLGIRKAHVGFVKQIMQSTHGFFVAKHRQSIEGRDSQ